MRLIAPPGVGLAPLRGRLGYPAHSLTLIAKVKLKLVHAGTAELLSAEAALPTGDEPYPDDESGQGAPRYESDYAFHKPRADVLLVGHFHAPGARPVKASEVALSVDQRALHLSVIGTRRWYGAGRLPDASQAEPFTCLPLRWELAYGGPGHAQNPAGRGYLAPESLTKGGRDFAREPLELPRIERPDKPFAYLDQPIDPVCFAPRARVWPVRRQLIGRCDERWLKQRWPWFPEDFDAGYFQAALPGLQQSGYLRGDEVLRIKHMHPTLAEYQTQLPGLGAIAAIQRAGAQGPRMETVPMNLDTLWVDMDSETAHLVWRGTCATCDADASDIAYAWVGLEAWSAALSPAEVEARAQAAIATEEAQWEMAPLPAPEPEPEANAVPALDAQADEPVLDPELAALFAALPQAQDSALPPLTAEQQALIDAATQRAAHELDAKLAQDEAERERQKPPPWTRERVRATRAAGGDLRGLDLTGLDLSGEDLSGADLSGTLLTGCRLDHATLSGAVLTFASLRGASLAETQLARAVLEDADLSESVGVRIALDGAQLARANLAQCRWEKVALRDANLSLVHAQGAHFVACSFSACTLDEADFSEAEFEDARFEGGSGQGASFRKAQLPRAQFVDVALSQADFSAAQLGSASFVRCQLDDAFFEQSRAIGLILRACSVARLRAEAAEFGFAQWSEVVGKDAVFEAAQWSDARLVQCQLIGADFTSCPLVRSVLQGCVLKRAKFTKADLTQALVLGSDCFEASFEAARLAHCDGTESSFFRAEFLDAQVGDFYGHERDLLGTKLAPVG